MSRVGLYWRLLQGVVENPRYYYFVLRRNAYNKTARRLENNNLPENGTFYPVKLDLRIIYGCNLRCKMCGQWGDTGTYFDYGTDKLQRVLTLDVIERVVRELAPHGLRYVDIEGGETFLYPQIIELLTMLKRRHLFVKPVTNGTLLKKYAGELIETGIDAIHVSVDGDKQAHNFVRQADWAYDRTLEGLQAIIMERERRHRHTPLVHVSFTMTRHNKCQSLYKLCEELTGKGLLDVLTIKTNPIWVSQAKGEAYNKMVTEYFGAEGLTSWTGFVEDYADFEEEAEQIAQTVRRLEAKNYDFFVHHLPSIPLTEIPKLYTNYDWNLGRTHCPVPYLEPTIDVDGHVYPCNLFTDEPLSMGNVNEQPFLDIWFGDKYQTFRRMLSEQGGLLPICNRCCQLTEH